MWTTVKSLGTSFDLPFERTARILSGRDGGENILAKKLCGLRQWGRKGLERRILLPVLKRENEEQRARKQWAAGKVLRERLRLGYRKG